MIDCRLLSNCAFGSRNKAGDFGETHCVAVSFNSFLRHLCAFEAYLFLKPVAVHANEIGALIRSRSMRLPRLAGRISGCGLVRRFNDGARAGSLSRRLCCCSQPVERFLLTLCGF